MPPATRQRTRSIALIKPTIGERHGRPYRTPAVLEPLVFAVLAASTPPGFDLAFFDERLEEVPYDGEFDLVALSVETYTARRAYQIATAFRKRGVPVVLGGFHPTLLPEEAAEYADAVAIGEVESTWPRLLADFAAGRLQPVYRADDPGGPVSPPFATDRRLFAGKGYLPVSLVETSRGCRHACHFCSVRRFYRAAIFHRPLAEVVREIEGLGRRVVFFVDDNIIADPARARELFKAIRPLGLRWGSQASLQTAADPEFLDLMVESGCLALIIGLESIFPDSLRQMGKAWHARLGSLEHLLDQFRRRGILIYASFVFGFDADTPARIRETVEFALAQRLFMANFNMLIPYPGTRIYDELAREGRLLTPRWWLSSDQRWDRPLFRPRGMSPDDLAAGVAEARRRFASLSSLFQRALDPQANFADPLRGLIYLAANLISRRDIVRKTGLRLGFSGESPP